MLPPLYYKFSCDNKPTFDSFIKKYSLIMFKKPFRVKTQTVMKGSDRKKLRAELLKSFDGLSQEVVAELIPSKDEASVVKIQTAVGDNMFIYCVNKNPILFEIDKEKVLYPTVYLLWQYPDLVPRFTTWPPVFKKMTEGADLMLPGVVLKETLSPNTFNHITKGQLCSVNLVGNRCPVSVGYTLMNGSDFYDSGMKGKGIHPLHFLGDELWSFGNKSSPPEVEDDPYLHDMEKDNDANENVPKENDKDSYGTENITEGVNGDLQDHRNDSDRLTDAIEETKDDIPKEISMETGFGATGGEINEANLDRLNLNEQEEREPNSSADVMDSTEADVNSPLSPEAMDEMLHFCLLCALKKSLKKSDLPIPCGTFYKVHMTKFCQNRKPLDVKKSTFKKLSKFLQKQEKTGIIKLTEISKGVDGISEFDKSHEMLRGFEAPDIEESDNTKDTERQFVPPEITEKLSVTAKVFPFFKTFGLSKKSAISLQEMRGLVTEYVKNNNLQSETDRSEVTLDPILAEITLKKEEGDRSTLKWDDLFSRIKQLMSPVFEIHQPGQDNIIQRGSLDPIKVIVEQRTSNKKVTVIENLDVYGIEAKEFGHKIQVKMACSATVSPSQQKGKGPKVTVQGNQLNCVADLLTNSYKIPKKYIKGLEKLPKSKR